MRLRNSVNRYSFSWVIFIALLLGCVEFAMARDQTWQLYESLNSQALSQSAIVDPVGAGQPVTVTTNMRLDLASEYEEYLGYGSIPDQVILAGMSSKPGTIPSALAVAWQLDTSAWLPAWNLYLISDIGLLDSPNQRVRLDAKAFPSQGNQYRSMLSFDPTTGMVSVRIVDETSDVTIYAGNIRVKPYDGVLYPGAATQSSDKDHPLRLEIENLQSRPFFVPVGAELKPRNRPGEVGYSASLQLADRREAWVIDVALPEQSLRHLLYVTYDDGWQQTLIQSLDGVNGNQQVVFDPFNVPAGQLDLVLNYMVDDELWELDRAPIMVGMAKVVLQDLLLSTDAEGQQVITGVVNLTTDGPFSSFNIYLDYDVHIPGEVAPVYVRWRNQTGSLQIPMSVDTTSTVIPFQIPIEPYAHAAAPSEVFLEVACTSDSGLPFSMEGLNMYALGERLPAFPHVGNYTVLRGDFHSHSTESDGKISPVERIFESYMYGYDILALTDHGTMSGYAKSADIAEQIGLVLLRGFETGINREEHLVVLGVDDDYQLRYEHNWARNPNEGRVFYQDQVREIIGHGGYIIYAHPGDPSIPPGPYSHPEGHLGWTDAIEWMNSQGYLHGIESRGSFPSSRRNPAFRWALKYDLTLFDVTDTHEPRNFSNSAKAPVTLVFTEESTPISVLEALRDGRTLIWHDELLRGNESWLFPFLDAVLDFELLEQDGKPIVQIRNKSPLVLYGNASVDAGSQSTFWLIPYGTFNLQATPSAQTVSIRWGNVQSAPEVAYTSDFEVK